MLSTSVAALLIGGGAPAAFAQCSTAYTNTTAPGCTNATTITGIAINNSTITSDINNTGTINPNGISFTNGSTLTGTLNSTGTLVGGISLDTSSVITSAGTAAISITGPTFLGGINNAGTIIGATNGIVVDGPVIFGGGISNSGTIFAGSGDGILLQNISTFSGGISNSGTISAAFTGIHICNCVTSFVGGISNGGLIAASFSGISVGFISVFGGGISNSGTITAASGNGISIVGVDTFSGGITNSGTILAGNGGFGAVGIDVLGVTTFQGGIINKGLVAASSGGIKVGGISIFGGGIANSGTIAAAFGSGIQVAGVGTFLGGISNSGTISAGSGNGISVFGVDTFTGGITNSGTIFATGGGFPTGGAIVVAGVSTFAGGILNQGTISSSSAGIVVLGVATFGGGISNSGTISANFATGISVSSVGTFSGGIANSGTIFAGSVGIDICGCVETFLGGITNSGLIAVATTGIKVAAASSFDGGITNTGTITASGSGIFGPGTGISVRQVSVFTGDISNAGLIAVGQPNSSVGISINGVSLFSGRVQNSGTIAGAGSGIAVNAVSLFSGGIGNSGTITGAIFGIAAGVNSGIETFMGGVSNGGVIAAARAGILVGTTGAMTISTFSGGITNTGTITLSDPTNNIGIAIGGVSTFSGGVTNSGLIALSQGPSSFGISVRSVSLFSGSVSNNGTITGANVGIEIGGSVLTITGGITNSGTIQATGVGISLSVDSSFGGHVVNTGTISVSPGGTAIDLTGSGVAITIDQNAGLIAGDISFSSHGDTLFVRGGTINGNVVGQNAGDTINFTLGTGTFTYAAAYGFTNISQVNVNSGVVILNGINDAINVAVNGGVLQVGDAANTGAMLTSTVDVIGGTLSGHGTIAGDVTIESGGVLFPGGSIGTLTITNSLTFNAGSFYLVQIAPGAGNNSATLVSGGAGTATINGGTVTVIPQLGHYNATTYTIVTATGGVSGNFASSTPTFVGPFAFTGSATLSYDTNDVFLNLSDGFALLAPTGANQNQQAVANGINAFILGTGASPPPQFANLANLPGPALLNALSQLSGENHAGFLQGAFQSGDLFLQLMVNPFLDGRFGSGGGFGAAMGFAAAEPPALPEAALAFAKAMPTKGPPLGISTSASAAYRAWGSAYGGTETVDGNAAVGSHRTTSRAFGFAAGIDYAVAPMTTLGFALAGGGTNWGLDGGLGSGHSDMFQAGAYGSHRWGAAYLSGALSYNFHDVTTDRTVTVAGVDRLTAGFQAHGVGARLEGGYRYATPWLGITPYAAAQVQSIFLPGYGETATAGSNQFALNFASQTATATRTELGAWFDKTTLLANGALMTLYGRAAWAHDFGNTRAVSAIFQGLPGSNFVVNGATPAPDSALLTAGALYRLTNGWSFQAKFDGEFASTTNVYSGTGVVKKTW